MHHKIRKIKHAGRNDGGQEENNPPGAESVWGRLIPAGGVEK